MRFFTGFLILVGGFAGIFISIQNHATEGAVLCLGMFGLGIWVMGDCIHPKYPKYRIDKK